MTFGKALLCTAVLFWCTACDALLGGSDGKAKRAVTKLLIDPTSAQFRNVHALGESVCGEVNGKNKMGAYVGFVRFVVSRSNYTAEIDPQFDYSDLMSARDLCSETSSNEYSSLSTMASACTRASELAFEEIQQKSFDRAWANHCGPAIAKQVYRPPLADTPASVGTNRASESDFMNLDTESLPDIPAESGDGGSGGEIDVQAETIEDTELNSEGQIGE